MATLGTYRITETDILPSQAGNGIIALYNKITSGKKVYIKNVELQNFRRDSIGANSRVTDWEILRISAITSGIEVTPAKLDSDATAIPSQIKVIKGGSPTYSTNALTISTTGTVTTTVGPPGTIVRGSGSWLTDGVIPGTKLAISGTSYANTGNITITTPGNLTFANAARTITRSAGSWVTDGVMPGAQITVTGTTSNNGTFTVLTRDTATQVTCIVTDLLTTEGPVGATYTVKSVNPYIMVRSTTATAITVETQHVLVTDATGTTPTITATIPISLGRFATRHNFFSTTTNAFFNNFNRGDKFLNTGSVYNANKCGTLVEPIWIAAGEGVAITMRNTLDIDIATDTKEFHTYLVECMFTIDWGGGEKTYFITDYMTPNGEDSPLFSIMNNTGSGQNVKIFDITISEIGDTSTPYFMVVPFDYMEPLAALDTYRNVSYMKMDSNYPAIDSYVNIKKDVSLYPKGFSTGGSLFPVSFGSAVPANGLNYYITKDFLGPIYSAFFAEKSELPAGPTTAVTNNFISFAQRDSTLFSGNDLYLNPGEGIAIVAAAEPITLASGIANQVNKFAMGKFGYSLTFSIVEETVDLILSGLVSGSEVKIFAHGTTTELATNVIPNTDVSFTWSYVYTAATYVDIVIMHLDYNYYRIDNLLLSAGGSTIPIQQITDRVYSNPT